MAVPTRSSRAANPQAWGAVLVGLLAVAVLPAAVAYAEREADIELLDAWVAIPFAFVGGVAALVLGRRARRRVQLTLGRVRGDRVARFGGALGVLAVCLAITASLAIAFSQLLSSFAE